MTEARGALAAELKRLIEGLRPDLRAFFRPSLLGTVVAVHDDDTDPDTYYRVDVVVGADEDTDEQGLSLPNVPCASLFAQDGYGVWALPEVGAEVTVSFHDGDVTRPYVEAPIFSGNAAPPGFKSGTFAIRGKQGQKIEMKPGTNEIVITCGSAKDVATQARQRFSGTDTHTVAGERRHIIASTDVRSALRERVDIKKDAIRSIGGTLSETVGGKTTRTYNAGVAERVGGSYSRVVTGGVSESATGAIQIFTGDTYSVLSVGGVTILSPKSITIGNVLTPDTTLDGLTVAVGSASTASTAINGAKVTLGTAASEPVPLGASLVTVLTALLATGANAAGTVTFSGLSALTTEAVCSKTVTVQS